MLSFQEKINYLKNSLNSDVENDEDSFKSDIFIYFEEFNVANEKLMFLNNLFSFEEIDNWIEKLNSRILMKFDFESEQISDFIYDYMELG